MSVGIEPLASMVLVEIEQAAEQTTSGLLLPEEAREKMTVGTVVAVGPEVENVAEGDRSTASTVGWNSSGWVWNSCSSKRRTCRRRSLD